MLVLVPGASLHPNLEMPTQVRRRVTSGTLSPETSLTYLHLNARYRTPVSDQAGCNEDTIRNLIESRMKSRITIYGTILAVRPCATGQSLRRRLPADWKGSCSWPTEALHAPGSGRPGS